MFNKLFFSKIVTFMKNMETYGRTRLATDDKMIRHTRIACWIPKATNAHSQYARLTAFPRQQWFRERPSLLHYTYTDCLVF
jgi:hypothetical protein